LEEYIAMSKLSKENNSKNNVGLYIHVPFCVTKCNYCKFYSNMYTVESAKTWLDKIILDLSRYEQIQFDTVFFGGGTPSLLWREVVKIMDCIAVRLHENAEVTVEANPCDVNRGMLEALLRSGVNRISIGVQSLDDEILKALGRRHDSLTATKAVLSAHEVGFDNISVDIMLGVPGQSIEMACRTIETLTNLPGMTHAAAYMFEAERTLPDDEMAELYLNAVECFEAHGFPQYEISNFGKPCKHNLKYWRCEEYIGLGPTAHSYYNGKRFATSENGEVYITEENPDTEEERVMLGLRLTEGIEAGEAMLERARAIDGEYIRINKGNLSLTPKGFLISNRIIGELLG
jgi:oxygen-independent coproporphyrinogen-3 oxidase